MRKFLIEIFFVLLLFFGETSLQILYYSIKIKFFDTFSLYEKFDKILFDSLFVIGTLKTTFFLPIYLIRYFFLFEKRKNISVFRQSLYHAILFLIIFLLLSILLPGNFAKNIIDTLILTIISFGAYIFSDKIFNRIKFSYK